MPTEPKLDVGELAYARGEERGRIMAQIGDDRTPII